MALLKFMTVYDDDQGQMLKRHKLYAYDLSAYPTVYFAMGKPYYDNVNSNCIMYTKFKEKGQLDDFMPTIPYGVFEEEFRRAYKNGYIGVVVICPHSKWTKYHSNAKIAAKRFYKSVKIDEMGFRIEIIDTKTFAAGTMYTAMAYANWYGTFRQSTQSFLDYVKQNISYYSTYILAYGPTCFAKTSGFSAFRLHRDEFECLDIVKYPDTVMFDKFAESIVAEIKRTDRRYVISMGNSCTFAGNILGRIEMESGLVPECAIQYAVASTSIFGSNAICISLV